MKSKFFLFAISFLLFYSCNFIDFGNDYVNCIPTTDTTFFDKEYVSVDFICNVDHYIAEQCLKINSDSQPLELVYLWVGNILYAKPEKGWINGKYYDLTLNGNIVKSNGAQFSVNYKCSFIHGSSEDSFFITDKVADNTIISSKDWVNFTFNHEVSYVDFSNSLKISPSEKLLYKINDDKKTFSIKPEEDWKINTIYTWEFNNLFSLDNWDLTGIKKGKFITDEDQDIPKLITICPVSDSSNSALWLENVDLNKNISKKECIGFIFSKEMDFSSVKSNISFSPSINGYFYPVENDKKRYLFVPLDYYEIETKYLISVSSDIKDISGNSLFEDIKKEFYSGDDFLTLSSLKIANNEYIEIPKEITVETTTLEEMETLSVVFTFSKPIEIESRYSVVNNISLSLNFPMTSKAPVLLSTKWDMSNTILTITWGNLTKSTSENNTYYDLKLNGGKSGLSTGDGIHMKENLCIHVNTL